MKRRILSIIAVLAVNILTFAQYSSGSLITVGSTGVSVKLETTPSLVRLTLTGPSNSYLGVGIGSSGMASGADGFIYNSNSATDYTFSGVGVTPSADGVQDWTVLSNAVAGSTRTIIATRSLTGGTGDTPIANAAGNINLFVARGNSTLSLSYHSSFRDYVTLPMSFDSLLATGEADFVTKAQIYPNPSKGIFTFSNAKDIKTVYIYETNGRKLESVTLGNNDSIDLQGKPSGTYYFEIQMKNGEVKYEKVIKE